MNTIEELALKNTMNTGLTHIKKPAHLTNAQFKGEAKYSFLAKQSDEFAQIYLLEDFMTGFVEKSSLGGTTECKNAMAGMIFYAFEMLKHREIYKPSNSMKVFIAFQSYQEQQALFYT